MSLHVPLYMHASKCVCKLTLVTTAQRRHLFISMLRILRQSPSSAVQPRDACMHVYISLASSSSLAYGYL